MSLFSELQNLMYDSVTVHRFVSAGTGMNSGSDTFNPATEVIEPVHITRHAETVYNESGRAVGAAHKIIMAVPSAGPVDEKDKLVSGEGEIFRVRRATRKKDKDGFEYQVVIAL